MKKMSKFMYVYLYLIAVLIVFWSFVSANTLSIGSSNTLTWRYFCPINLPVTVNYDGNDNHSFGNCQFWLQFDPSYVSLQYSWIWSNFTKLSQTFFIWNNTLYVDVKNEESFIYETSVCADVTFNTISSIPQTTSIKFVDQDGSAPTQSTYENTAEWLNVSHGWQDTLTWVQDLTINLYACPCKLDNDKPVITGRFINWSAYNSTTHYVWTQTVKVLVYDKDKKASSLRWYWTRWTKNLANYTWWAPAWMDNQEWINSGTIVVNIYSGDTVIQTLTRWNWLTVTAYTWSSNTPRYTWDWNDRWYRVSFDTNSLSIETPVTIDISVYDNALDGSGDCHTQAHSSKDAITLNQKRPPIITFNSPIGDNVNPNAWVMLTVSDERAWIDTGSLVVEILPVISWGQTIMSWSIYSWSDLTFHLISGSTGLWWASKYEVTFQPMYEFPVSSRIILSGYVEDLVGMLGQKTHEFGTRADCTFYGCVNFVDIFFWDTSNMVLNWFTWSLIVITWTIADYPYLTWLNGDIVMCGPINESINLTWNIDIYSGDEIINWNVYPYGDLYVTGLDFEYQDGVIIPRY